jgi:hypothetical protein
MKNSPGEWMLACSMKPVAPPRVRDHYEFWSNPPPEPSPRLLYWKARIAAGWRPGRFIRRMGYDESAEYYGVWIWEYTQVLRPLLAGL